MSLGENMENEVLHATHEGKLVLDNTTIDVAVLNNGQRSSPKLVFLKHWTDLVEAIPV